MDNKKDRELLEAAAKAAGIEFNQNFTDDVAGIAMNVGNTGRWWNPLTSDADALRLAVKLDLLRHPEVSVFPQGSDNELEATRRAIVRAASEIGKTQEEIPA